MVIFPQRSIRFVSTLFNEDVSITIKRRMCLVYSTQVSGSTTLTVHMQHKCFPADGVGVQGAFVCADCLLGHFRFTSTKEIEFCWTQKYSWVCPHLISRLIKDSFPVMSWCWSHFQVESITSLLKGATVTRAFEQTKCFTPGRGLQGIERFSC